jgi:hypothetical protein
VGVDLQPGKPLLKSLFQVRGFNRFDGDQLTDARVSQDRMQDVVGHGRDDVGQRTVRDGRDGF